MIEKSHRWHKTAIAAAAAALLTLNATDASALSLGRIAVQSALGETLRAEIDIPEINAEEAATLHAGVVPAAAFAAAGLEYNAVMAGLQATLMRRPDGRAYLRLTTDRAVNDPFVDLILEASWSSGRIVRDYTLLLDPPQVKAQVAPPTLPQTNAAGMSPSKPQAATPPASTPAPALATSENGRNTASAPKSTPPNATNRVSAAPAPTEKATASPSGNQLVVKAGDTASKLAQANKASDVSLDQMLVAMMRNNPDAFSKGNLNRLRAGAVLDLPSAEQAKTISTAEASQIVVAQSKDFNEFRRTLAENAPKTESETPNRKASGNVEARVDERKSANATPDKLTLSKGALAAAKSAEAALAKDRAKQDAADRAAELERNIADLNKLKSATESTATAATGSANAPAMAAGTAPAMAASEDKAMAPAAPIPMPAPVASAPMVPPAPVPEPSLVDQFLQDPVIPLAGAGGVLALIAGLWAARRRAGKKKELNHVDSSFLESRLTADSFFGASGGQQVDTAGDSASSTGAPPVYAASQSDPADDVDPVAEADVYLAYGRDLQAEEILKEALRSNPSRIAIHQKMLEIFAKRRDAVSFQQSATLVQKLTGGEGEDWQRVCAMGLGIDPENPLYQGAKAAAAPTARTSAFGGLETSPSPGPDTVASSGLDLDLDIDFPDGDAAPSIIKTVTSRPAPLSATPEVPAADSNALDFDLSMPAELSAKPAAPEATFVHEPFVEAPELALHEPAAALPVPAAEPEAHPAHQAATELQHLETQAHHLETQAHELEEDATPAANAGPDSLLHFDMSGLSLDLDSPTQAGDLSQPAGQHSLETKLALAEEFVSIGDHDGARALIEEVIADASGPTRERAEQALAALR